MSEYGIPFNNINANTHQWMSLHGISVCTTCPKTWPSDKTRLKQNAKLCSYIRSDIQHCIKTFQKPYVRLTYFLYYWIHWENAIISKINYNLLRITITLRTDTDISQKSILFFSIHAIKLTCDYGISRSKVPVVFYKTVIVNHDIMNDVIASRFISLFYWSKILKFVVPKIHARNARQALFIRRKDKISCFIDEKIKLHLKSKSNIFVRIR